jgi:hypothetical protein
VNVQKGRGQPIPGVVSGFHDRNKARFQVCTADGRAEFYNSKQILEFKDQTILFTSLLSTQQIDTKWMGYINPKSRVEAMKRHDWPEWQKAENLELGQFKDLRYLVNFVKERPKGVFIHKLRFVYQIKVFTDGTLDKYKVRIVFRGFTQILFRDFEETYAPVTQLIAMKLFYFKSCEYALETGVLDIKSAYLNAEIDRELWVELPDGITHEGTNYAQVNKAIPGVKQGAYLWYSMFTKHLKRNGFIQGDTEPCLFKYFTDEVQCQLLIHTDNVMYATSDNDWLDRLIKYEWSTEFTATRVSDKSILGLHVERIDTYTIAFSQKFYIESMINDFGLKTEKPVILPIRHNIENDYDPSLMKKHNKKNDKETPYRQLVMRLMWVARSYRYEILYAVGFFARFSNCYTKELYGELLKVLLFLKGTIDFKLYFNVDPSKELQLQFTCDANFATFVDR